MRSAVDTCGLTAHEPDGRLRGPQVIGKAFEADHRVIMNHRVSTNDRQFIADLEAAELAPAQFDHRAHVRAAYVYLADADSETATERMRATLLAFLRRHNVAPSKYHATMTKAWILAVRHFMAITPEADSADAFIDANPLLLDSRIMLTHYSAELLFSPEARADFVEPDQSPIPKYE